MVQSKATTVDQYLDELPPDRRETVAAVREVVLANLPEGYEETMSFGMIGYVVPFEIQPETYNGQPLGVYRTSFAEKLRIAVSHERLWP